MSRPRQRLETARWDGLPTTHARSIGPLVKADDGSINQSQVLDRPIAKREVALLLEDLARRCRLRAVGHLVRGLDGLTDLAEESGAFGLQCGAKSCGIGRVHRLTLRVDERRRTGHGEDYRLGSSTKWRVATAVALGRVGGMSDPYDVLQVHRRAEPEVIHAAFRALARKYHPDSGGNSARMVEITEAYAILGNAERKATFDAQPVMPGDARAASHPSPAPLTWQPAAQESGRAQPMTGSTIDFGRYAGWTVGALVEHDPDYLEWLARTPVGRRLTGEIERALSRRAAQSAALRPTPKAQRRSFVRPWATAGSAAR